MTKRYLGIGKNSIMNINKHSFSLFFGLKMVTIAYHTPKYGIGLRFYFYDNLKEMQENDLFSALWFFGLIF